MNIKTIPIDTIRGIDKVALINPLMQEMEFEALKLSIYTYGMEEPITICRNLILDGRNRYNACLELGIKEIKVNEIANNVTIEYKKQFVKKKETRRMQSKTQLACTAVDVWNTDKPNNMTQKEFVVTYGVSIANFANAQWLYKNNNQVFKALKEGKSVQVDKVNKYKTSDSLLAVVKYYKSLEVGVDKKEIDEEYKDSIMISVDSIINPMLDAMIISLNALNIPPERKENVKEEVAKTLYAKFKNN